MTRIPVQALIVAVEQEGRRTDRILRAMPDGFYGFSPSPNLRPVRELLRHIASIYLYVARALGEDRWDVSVFDTQFQMDGLDAAVDALAAAREACIAAARACPYGRLYATVSPFGFAELAITYLRRAVDHEIHHRGELSVYAALAGHTIGDLYECERGGTQSMPPPNNSTSSTT